MELIAATGNKDKLIEFRRMLEPLGIQVLSCGDAGVSLSVEESGTTFAQNARIKAQEIYRLTGKAAVADDSGLCVDALDGQPGVYSSRYCGENTPYPEKMEILLKKLERVPQHQRGAQFVCAICCVLDDDTVLDCQGICSGYIGQAPVGDGGFGYDPIFMVGYKSFAQLHSWEKDKVSHRGKALRNLVQELEPHLKQKDK